VIEVVTPGLQTTIQDLGRWGYQAFGVSVAGAMDPRAHRIANALIGNPLHAATLEIAFTGPELLFETACTIAVSGAWFALRVDNEAVPMNSVVEMPAGSRLDFGERRRGARAYLAVTGGIDVPPVFGSRSTHVSSRMGGLEGRALVRGDRLTFDPRSRMSTARRDQRIRVDDDRSLAPARPIRILPGPQEDHFADRALDVLQSAEYVVQGDSNRMGFRLSGPQIEHKGAADIISDATVLGAVQVPASGLPVLLMADRQTTGGYPKIATVISADIPAVAQTGPGESLRFVKCTRQEALAALVDQEQFLLSLEVAT
jgi:antagonist of KipI